MEPRESYFSFDFIHLPTFNKENFFFQNYRLVEFGFSFGKFSEISLWIVYNFSVLLIILFLNKFPVFNKSYVFFYYYSLCLFGASFGSKILLSLLKDEALD